MSSKTIKIKKRTIYIVAAIAVIIIAVLAYSAVKKPSAGTAGTVDVGLTVLNDKDCATCDTTQIVGASEQLFPGVKITNVDISSSEGKKLIETFGIVYVPAYIFDSKITQTESWANPQMPASFQNVGDKYRLLDEVTGASHFIDEEKQKEFLSSIGVVTGDNKPQIDFFVMSFCPYGNVAEEAIEPAYQLLKGKADFIPHYVIYENYGNECLENGAYCSMHGAQELNQDIREICVYKKLGIEKYFQFVLAANKKCTASNADSCWEDVAKGVGIDTQMVKDCQQNEAISLLAPEKALGNKLGVQGSPTVFIDGEKASVGTPDAVKSALCAAFETAPSECGSALSATAQAASGNCG
jgi:hypothetical protein